MFEHRKHPGWLTVQTMSTVDAAAGTQEAPAAVQAVERGFVRAWRKSCRHLVETPFCCTDIDGGHFFKEISHWDAHRVGDMVSISLMAVMLVNVTTRSSGSLSAPQYGELVFLGGRL